jgi:hypothetical protein
MAQYTVKNEHAIFGVYDGLTPADAIETYARDAGYDSYAELCKVAPSGAGTVEAVPLPLTDEQAANEAAWATVPVSDHIEF